MKLCSVVMISLASLYEQQCFQKYSDWTTNFRFELRERNTFFVFHRKRAPCRNEIFFQGRVCRALFACFFANNRAISYYKKQELEKFNHPLLNMTVSSFKYLHLRTLKTAQNPRKHLVRSKLSTVIFLSHICILIRLLRNCWVR